MTGAANTAGDLLGDLDYPMMIVTAAAAALEEGQPGPHAGGGAGETGERSGCLVGFGSQCSIEPVLLMVWISDANHTAGVARRANTLGVHFPSSADRGLAELFGGETGDRTDKFARCRWHTGPSGVPILDDCARWCVGEILERVPTGDHTGYLLRSVASAEGSWPGQLSFRAVADIEPGHGA